MNGASGLPLTGNIYCDRFSDQGHTYRDYAIDCGDCGREEMLSLSRHHRAKAVARQAGWGTSPAHGKWLCPDCLARAVKEVH